MVQAFSFKILIGAMKRDRHPELYDKSTAPAFTQTGKKDAKGFYHERKSDNDVELIDPYYVEWSGLTLEEVLGVFRDGDWLLGNKKHSYGGPRP